MSKKILTLAMILASLLPNICLEAQQEITYQCEFGENNLYFSYEIPIDFKKIKFGAEPEEGAHVFNYIHKDENPEIWTELRQICYVPESVENPIDFLNFLKKALDPEDKYPIKTSVENGINVCWGIFEHSCPRIPNHPVKTACIMGSKLFSGKDVTWTVQNMIMYDPKTITPEQKKELIEKVETFFKNCKLTNKI